MSEIEYNTVQACKFETAGKIRTAATNGGDHPFDEDAGDKHHHPWQLVHGSSSSLSKEKDHSILDCIFSPPGATIRLAPMDRIKQRSNNNPGSNTSFPMVRWKETVHFHPLLVLDSQTKKSGGSEESEKQDELLNTNNDEDCLVCLWQAVAREGVIVAMSPKPHFCSGNTYEVCFGAQGNTRTTIRRQCNTTTRTTTTVEGGGGGGGGGGGEGDPESLSSSLTVSRPCRLCQERSWTSYWICYSQGKVYAGVGDSPGHDTVAILDDLARQNTPPSSENVVRYVGIGNAGVGDRQAPSPIKVRNVRLCKVPEHLKTHLLTLSMDKLETVHLLGTDEMDEETKALMLEYEEECRKAQARAAKFGTVYKEPPPDAFLPWSQARRLKANPKAGFVTGFDMSSEDEKAKQEARMKRFGISQETPATSANGGGGDEEMGDSPLPVVQAWDNEEFVRGQRIDPPLSLWILPPADTDAGPAGADASFSMEEETPTLVPEKIFIFSIDWAAFKQIRTNDVMRYFSIYGPSYVEWLGDLSCNVHFEDKFSAARALENLGQELPSPPPAELSTTSTASAEEGAAAEETPPDFGAMGWRFCKSTLRKIANDKYGRRGTTARLLMRMATSLDILSKRPSSWPKPPPGFSTKRVLGPGSDFVTGGTGSNEKRRRSEHEERKHQWNPQWNPASGDEHHLLSGGLSSGRGGFSVEEMETERAMKRAKTTDEE